MYLWSYVRDLGVNLYALVLLILNALTTTLLPIVVAIGLGISFVGGVLVGSKLLNW